VHQLADEYNLDNIKVLQRGADGKNKKGESHGCG
jgi:hypothetical protein